MDTSEYRKRYAAFQAELESARYKISIWLHTEASLEHIYEQYSDVFSRDSIESLRKVMQDTPEFLETERASLSRLVLEAQKSLIEATAFKLAQECRQCETSAMPEWDGLRHSSWGLQLALASETDITRRLAISDLYRKSIRSCNEVRASRLESISNIIRSLGFNNEKEFATQLLQMDVEQLAESTQSFVRQTDELYLSELSRISEGQPPPASHSLSCFDWLFLRRAQESAFPLRQVPLAAAHTSLLNALGISGTRQTRIGVETYNDPSLQPLRSCWRLSSGDIRITVLTSSLIDNYRTLFHAAGHAQHMLWTSPELTSRNPEFVYTSESAAFEASALLFDNLFQDREWLSYFFNLSIESAQGIARWSAFLDIFKVRLAAAMLRYELIAKETADLRSEELSESYSEQLKQVTSIQFPTAAYLAVLSDNYRPARYLRAAAFEVALREQLLTRYGRRWWNRPKARDELIDLWNTGSRYSVEELGRMLGLGDLSLDLLAERLIEKATESD